MDRDTTTTPYLNLVRGTSLAAFSEEYSQVCSLYYEAGLKPVSFMKEKFGKQAYCFTSYRRYWVWEDPAGWRIYAHNEGGIGFEVDSTLDLDGAI